MRISLTFRAVLKATMALVIDIKITCDDTGGTHKEVFKNNMKDLYSGYKQNRKELHFKVSSCLFFST